MPLTPLLVPCYHEAMDESLRRGETSRTSPLPALTALFRPDSREEVVAVAHQTRRAAQLVDPPATLSPVVRTALAAAGVHTLFSHQRQAYELLAEQGCNVVIATGTASGKSFCFLLPVLDAIAHDPQARALLLYPTKALAQDQARKISLLRGHGAVTAIYDGDTPREQRRQIRQRASVLLSNPDMLHVGILPGHDRWAEFLHHLRYVVVDEAHVYRGVFGSHVAQVLRRLRRLCATYGSNPRFVLASATIANPQELAERLVGLPFRVITEDGAPRAERTIVLWNPPLEDPALGTRHSILAEASAILGEVILAGARAIVFAPTRKATELIYAHTRARLEERARDWSGAATPANRILPYRAGYTPQQRRDIERRLFEQEVDAVVATSALELGIDVGDLDLSLVAGFPGTVTSLLQRWGRAGRSGHGWAVLVAGQDALDQFFMREPERLLSRPVEQAIIDLENPHILDAHLLAAAYERPLTETDEDYFGEVAMRRVTALECAGRLVRSESGSTWTEPRSPAADFGLRSASGDHFLIVEKTTGGLLGSVEQERVFRTAHPGAVYLHLGESYLVTQLDLPNRLVLVEPSADTTYTQPKVDKSVTIASQELLRPLSPESLLCFGEIDVTEQVIAYQKRDIHDHRVLDAVALDLPAQTFATKALWLTISQSLADHLGANLGVDRTPDTHQTTQRTGTSQHLTDTLHAAEHALIAILPLYAMCDRWDIGGLSTAWHWQTDRATVFIYDGYPKGIDLARRAYDKFAALAADAAALIAGCPCETGCPSCVQSPKCGNLNDPLDKEGALRLLRALLTPPPEHTGGQYHEADNTAPYRTFPQTGARGAERREES